MKELIVENNNENIQDEIDSIKNDATISGYEEDNIDEEDTVENSDNIIIDIPWKNREISWLDYNYRIINRSKGKDISLEQKLVFLGYASANLDEFISVRFSELYNKYDKENINEDIYQEVLKYIKNQRCIISKIIQDSIYNYYSDYFKDINDNILNIYFMTNIFPALTPISITNNKDIPMFNDSDINFLIKLKDLETNKKSTYCILQIPSSLGRVIRFEDKYIFIEEIVEKYLNIIFSNKIIHSYIIFKVNKDYSGEVSKDVRDKILTRVDDMLKNKRKNNIIFVDIAKNEYSDKLTKDIIKLTKVPKEHINMMNSNREIGLDYLKNKPYKKITGKNIDKIKSVIPNELFGYDSILEYLDDNNELLLHHPYETYDLVVNFIKEAAIDQNVISIKQTLYRVSSEKSPIIKALCLAAKNGIRVTVMLELLARFDEKQNIKLVDKLKSAGCTVIYSLDKIKTHCKICLITKSTKKGLKTYSHIGTGNYNEKTSTGYADISYFTTDNIIASELASVFNMITGFSNPTNLNTIYFSPITLRNRLEDLISNYKDYGITKVKIKVNSISDYNIIKNIYEAADSGLKFDIICRGVCSLIPRNNISVKSVVGKVLEHSRLYIFERDKDLPLVYISSSDLLTRNLDKRIELLIPITNIKYMNKIINIFDILIQDEYNSFWCKDDGYWVCLDQPKIDCYKSFVIE